MQLYAFFNMQKASTHASTVADSSCIHRSNIHPASTATVLRSMAQVTCCGS